MDSDSSEIKDTLISIAKPKIIKKSIPEIIKSQITNKNLEYSFKKNEILNKTNNS